MTIIKSIRDELMYIATLQVYPGSRGSSGVGGSIQPVGQRSLSHGLGMQSFEVLICEISRIY
jgi:hypothetical protein